MLESYAFGPFRLIPKRGVVTKDDVPIPVGTRALAILQLLAERAPALVDTQQIMARVWPGIYVEEANIRVHISALRRALGQGHGIVNRAGRGYALETSVQYGPHADSSTVPIPSVTLIGREKDVSQLHATLSAHSLTTLVGPGGIGKTSVALAAVHDLAAKANVATGFVDLSPLIDPALVISRVAQALSVTPADPYATRELSLALRERDLLLILDNCEHVLDGVVPLVEQLLADVAGLRILATSREPLHIAGEHVHRLMPLALPEEDAADEASALRSPALRLLLDRAAGNEPPFVLDRAELPLAIRLSRALDGIPLAIELAAARLDGLPLAMLLDDLDQHLATPPEAREAVQARHRTLGATLDWSFQLLPSAERSLLTRLGVFRGAISLAGVCAAGSAGMGEMPDHAEGQPLDEAQTRASLTDLIDKSLVIVDLGADQPTYRLLDTTRDYAARKLAEGPWGPHVARSHAGHVRLRLKELAIASPLAPELRQLENRRLLDDLRAALDWAFSPSGDMAIGAVLTAEAGPFFLQISLIGEYRRHAERALAAIGHIPGGAPSAEMRILATLGTASYHEGPSGAVLAAHSRALEIAEQLGDLAARRRSLWGVWLYHFGQGEYAEGLPYAEAYRACTPPEDDPLHAADRSTALSLTFLGRLSAARMYTERVLAQPMPQGGNVIGDFQFEPRAALRALLARILWLQGFADQARAVARESLDETMASGHALSLCFSMVIGHGFIVYMTGGESAIEEAAEQLRGVAEQNALHFWAKYARILSRAGAVQAGHLPGTDDAFLHSEEWSVGHTELMAALGLGHPHPDGLARFEHGSSIWSTPEILRHAAEACLPDAPCRAEELLDRAAAVAREQGALAWELRVALSRTRMARSPVEAQRAHAGLESVVSRFSEGFDTKDLLEAHRLLLRGTRIFG